jgi:hypothetical protein
MEPYQWFLLGVMAAWTPGMIVLALFLWRTPTPEMEPGRPEEIARVPAISRQQAGAALRPIAEDSSPIVPQAPISLSFSDQ